MYFFTWRIHVAVLEVVDIETFRGLNNKINQKTISGHIISNDFNHFLLYSLKNISLPVIAHISCWISFIIFQFLNFKYIFIPWFYFFFLKLADVERGPRFYSFGPEIFLYLHLFIYHNIRQVERIRNRGLLCSHHHTTNLILLKHGCFFIVCACTWCVGGCECVPAFVGLGEKEFQHWIPHDFFLLRQNHVFCLFFLFVFQKICYYLARCIYSSLF